MMHVSEHMDIALPHNFNQYLAVHTKYQILII